MAQQNGGEFYKLVGYGYNRFSPDDYKNVVKNAERVYRERPEYWQKLLTDKIELMGFRGPEESPSSRYDRMLGIGGL